jgi:trans-aconitate methyltransferase
VADRTSWNAEVYERIGTPMQGWAQAVIDDLDLKGNETVLDAGCGSGSVTFDLLERLPDGHIYALDSSQEMIDKLTQSLGERGITNVTPMRADLADFSLPEQVDVIFSNAVFHWIHDDDGLFGSLFLATKPGGRMRAQCGGGDIFARLTPAVDAVRAREAFAPHTTSTGDAKNFRTPAEAVAAMQRAGWTDARADTFDAPVEFEDENDAVLYLATIILRDHTHHIPEDLQDSYFRAIFHEYIDRYGPPFTADYVRLNLWARRPVP